MNNTQLISYVYQLTKQYRDILSIESALELGLHGGPGNGSGPRTKLSKLFINTTIYGSNKQPITYPKSYEEYIELSKDHHNLINNYKQNRHQLNLPSTTGVIGFIIHGENTDINKSRPIRTDIKQYYKQQVCILCGTNHTICDHKNDLYNDPRVLSIETQRLDDFQALCNSCNLRKRAVSLKRDKLQKRQPPPPVIVSMNGGIQFTVGDESYNPLDPNALVGTYWYDPIQFVKDCHRILSCHQSKYYSV